MSYLNSFWMHTWQWMDTVHACDKKNCEACCQVAFFSLHWSSDGNSSLQSTESNEALTSVVKFDASQIWTKQSCSSGGYMYVFSKTKMKPLRGSGIGGPQWKKSPPDSKLQNFWQRSDAHLFPAFSCSSRARSTRNLVGSWNDIKQNLGSIIPDLVLDVTIFASNPI